MNCEMRSVEVSLVKSSLTRHPSSLPSLSQFLLVFKLRGRSLWLKASRKHM